MKKLFELKPKYDSGKSFYKKAFIEINNNALNRTIKLYSYETLVMTISKKTIRFYKNVNYNQTTMRHIRECLKQYDEYAIFRDKRTLNITAKQIAKANYIFNNTKSIIGTANITKTFI